ncbi:MAG: hypothetical protein N3A62_08715 [Thermodesulfovibrionales bacterium]|nr:hypothetical protein [Thermodesulfovibrionales bacterium]
MLDNLVKNKKFVFKTINVCLLVISLFIILFFSRDVLSFVYRERISLNPEKARNETRYLSFKDYEVIVKNNLFSNNKSDPYEIKISQSKPEQRVDYKLVGTISGDRNFGYAIFSDAKGMQEVVGVGKKLEGLGVVYKVQKDKVIIKSEDGSQREIVLADIVSVQETQQPTTTKSGSDLVRQTGEKTFTVDQKKIQQAIDNPQQIMTDARLLPNYVDGVQKGFVLREVKVGGIYHSLGLRDGDVLLRINEYNINNPESGLQAFMALKGLERVNLDIIRGGSNTTLTYLLR